MRISISLACIATVALAAKTKNHAVKERHTVNLSEKSLAKRAAADKFSKRQVRMARTNNVVAGKRTQEDSEDIKKPTLPGNVCWSSQEAYWGESDNDKCNDTWE